MSRRCLILIPLLFSLAACGNQSADLNIAKAAYEKGDYTVAYKEYKSLAEKGNAEAQQWLGQMYNEGKGVPENRAEAVKWFQKAAEQGNAEAQFRLARKYIDGTDVQKDYHQAKELYHKAADQGNTGALWNLGFLHEIGAFGVDKDCQEAVYWYSKGAEKGDGSAKTALERLSPQCFGEAKAKQLTTDKARLQEQTQVPTAHTGLQDASTAFFKRDYSTAFKEFKPLAEQGNAEAQFSLGLMYEHAFGVRRDNAEAVKWYRKAAEQGQKEAQFSLGVMYYVGKQGYSESFLSEMSMPLAERELFSLTSVPQDYAEAARWYRKAAEQGDPIAQQNLGYMYLYGQGVQQDYIHAYMWLNLSATQAADGSAELRDKTAARMTPSQIAEAQRLARKWKPKGHD